MKHVPKSSFSVLNDEPSYDSGRIFANPIIQKLARGLKIEYYVVPMSASTMKVDGLVIDCWRDPISDITYTAEDRLYNVRLSEL